MMFSIFMCQKANEVCWQCKILLSTLIVTFALYFSAYESTCFFPTFNSDTERCIGSLFGACFLLLITYSGGEMTWFNLWSENASF